jgi:hypothetical protein
LAQLARIATACQAISDRLETPSVDATSGGDGTNRKVHPDDDVDSASTT